MDDTAIKSLLARLARPHSSGGDTIERAALLAAGSDLADVIAWIGAHGGEPETRVAATASLGLHGTRISGGSQAAHREPQRYVLPSGALTS